MRAERVVQIHVAALTTIGAVLLGMGQRDPKLPLLVVFAAVTSLIFTDMLNWFRLNRLVANLLALVALFFSIGDFVQPNTRTQLLAIANLLVYWQITSFYQRKSSRIYWHLIVFSLLQVVVSAALNVEFEFGVVLIVYIAVGISTLAFFFALREVSQIASERRSSRRRNQNVTPNHQTEAKDESRWKRLAAYEMVAAPVASRRRLGRQAVSWGFFGEIAVICLTTMVFSFVLFFSAPRMEGSALAVRRSRGTNVVGFSRKVTLNELTNVLQSDEPVMRLSFVDYQTGNPYLVFGDPYIRGSVLPEYVIDNGVPTWSQGIESTERDWGTLGGQIRAAVQEFRGFGRPNRKWRLPSPPANQKLVCQSIILQPIDEPVLFGVFPAFADGDTPRDVRYNPYTGQLFSQSQRHRAQRQEYRYSLATSAFRGGLQVDVTPFENYQGDRDLLDDELAQLRRFDESRFPRLKEIADEIAKEQRASNANDATLAQALRDHFQDPALYKYSLDFRSIRRDPNLDPIEDFVANHHTGHCEYYASALAMMLRSQGIPSRLVIGFKPSEYNEVGGYYQVLQRDAHAWVEAYLRAEDITGEVPSGTYISPAGGWLRLEPTLGAADDADAEYERGFMDVVDDMLDHARTLWTDYILGLTARRQRESIYGPVTESADPAVWEAFLDQLRKERDMILRWLRSQAAILIVSAGALLAAFYLMLRRRARRANAPPVIQAVRRWTSRLVGRSDSDRRSGNSQRVVEFYHRFESLLAGAGIMRRHSQTQRELASEASDRFSNRSSTGTIDGLIARIVNAFYCVRFGQVSLDERETEAIENALTTLEGEVTTNRRTPSQYDESSER